MVQPRLQLRIQGSLPGGEVWSINPNFVGVFSGGEPTGDEVQGWATAIAAGLNGWMGALLQGALSAQVSVTNVVAAYYDADGKLALQAEAAPTSQVVGNGAMIHPGTTAVALSLITGTAGRRYRGRLFFPALGLPVQTTGRVAASNTADLATQAASLLRHLEQAWPGFNDVVTLVVYSQKNGTGLAVATIGVGDVLDNVRSRKDALKENYSLAVMPQ